MRNTLVINLFAGPGAGKSTIASQLFSKLKWNKIETELVSEYAKDLVWEESLQKLKNQIYVFAKQHKRQQVLKNKVDVIITDSPILLILFYDKGKTNYLQDLVISEHNKFNNFNIFIKRACDYNPNGRVNTYEESLEIDNNIENFLIQNNMEYTTIEGTQNAANEIYNLILEKKK